MWITVVAVVAVTTGRGFRHIRYKQQHEQVKHRMMVTVNTTKMVTPTATKATGILEFLSKDGSSEFHFVEVIMHNRCEDSLSLFDGDIQQYLFSQLPQQKEKKEQDCSECHLPKESVYASQSSSQSTDPANETSSSTARAGVQGERAMEERR